ncbi:MAG: DUF72 domain-containing protein [Polyangiaceae bacterium]|nr:DUF72 domain-containing protein [Polyangiaceae bacterium]
MRLCVGHAALHGSFERYCEELNLLEVPADVGRAPRRQRLQQLREQAPEDFVFSVVLPTAVASLDATPETEAELVRALGIVELLRAEWLLLRTPSSVRPGERTAAKLERLVERLHGQRVAWEPAGLFDDRNTEHLAARLSLTLVRDLSRVDPAPGPVVYTRLRSLGRAGRLPESAAERVADALGEVDEVFVVVDAPGAKSIARQLHEMLGSEPTVGGEH